MGQDSYFQVPKNLTEDCGLVGEVGLGSTRVPADGHIRGY
jgi:hypothetical protein